MSIRRLPQQEERVETGPVQFGDDWPGVFVRGDNAMWHAHMLSGIIGRIKNGETLEDWDVMHLEMMRDMLKESDARTIESRLGPEVPDEKEQ